MAKDDEIAAACLVADGLNKDGSIDLNVTVTLPPALALSLFTVAEAFGFGHGIALFDMSPD